MLDTNRIKAAEKNVKSYLEEGLLKKTTQDKHVVNILTKNAQESLIVAEEVSKRNISDLWVIVCSYYSMYYYANAVLLTLGYKVGDKIVHKVTSDALIAYVRKRLKESLLEAYEETKEEALNLAGLRADDLIESFEFERNKRSFIQYKTIDTEKQSKSRTSLQRAKVFAKEMSKLLIENDNMNEENDIDSDGGLWDDNDFAETVGPADIKAKMNTFSKRHDEDMNYKCRKCNANISVHNKDWHNGLCDKCFNGDDTE